MSTSILTLLSLTLKIAARNLWLYRLRTTIIGLLLAFGAFLAVIGLSLLNDIEKGMRTSITESIAGDLQIYSNNTEDELALFGGGFMGRPDLGVLSDFAPIRDVVLTHPNVKNFIPMGIDMAMLARGNELDDAIDALRHALKSQDQSIIKNQIEQIQFSTEQLTLELAEKRKLTADIKEIDQQALDIKTAQSKEFIEGLSRNEEDKLQFLETKIAPLSGEKQPVYLNYLGTDIKLFTESFSKFKILQGERLPTDKRGLLLSHKIREKMLKNKAARLFDELNKKVTKNHTLIKGNPENELTARELPRQHAQIQSYLNREESEELSQKLSSIGIKPNNSKDFITGLSQQIIDFLTVNDENLAERFTWFYTHIAPKIKLYEISPGETIILRSYTRSGYVKSVPLKVYGVFTFAGLEDSDLAGAMNLVDLVSFRELFGEMTEESRKELAQMRAAVGIKDISSENAEAELFGNDTPQSTTEAKTIEQRSEPVIQAHAAVQDSFSIEEIKKGLAINAAIQLKDPQLQAQTITELEASLKKANLDLKVINWQKASGVIGQMVNIVGGVLVFALFVIFLVALIIINNTVIVGTLNRIREIGTMRAIGTQKNFVVGLFLAETGITAVLGAVLGTLGATLLLLLLNKKGIPAANDFVQFMFAGPRLYPTIQWFLILSCPVFIALLATLASVYAARHAARVKPVDAMQEKE